jgi:hypothetical protein
MQTFQEISKLVAARILESGLVQKTYEIAYLEDVVREGTLGFTVTVGGESLKCTSDCGLGEMRRLDDEGNEYYLSKVRMVVQGASFYYNDDSQLVAHLETLAKVGALASAIRAEFPGEYKALTRTADRVKRDAEEMERKQAHITLHGIVYDNMNYMRLHSRKVVPAHVHPGGVHAKLWKE